MGILKGRSDAGQGGKRGHSNMDHWEFTEEIKAAARKRRRIEAKIEITRGLIEFEEFNEPEPQVSAVPTEAGEKIRQRVSP